MLLSLIHILNIRKSIWKHRIWQDSSLSRRNTFLKPSLRKRRFKLNFSKLIAYFLKAVYTVNSRWAICLSCGLTHKIRLSFRTSGAGQLTEMCIRDRSNASKPQCHSNRQDRTVDQYPIHSFQFFYTIVLAGKAHACLGDGIDRHIQESLSLIHICKASYQDRHRPPFWLWIYRSYRKLL